MTGLGLGWIFLWPFLDNTFGLGHETPDDSRPALPPARLTHLRSATGSQEAGCQVGALGLQSVCARMTFGRVLGWLGRPDATAYARLPDPRWHLRDALRFAVGEAQMRGARLRIVSAWSVPSLAYSGGFAANVDPDMFRKNREAESARAVAFARELAPDLEIEATTPHAQSAAALLAASEGADLLVVGSRGHGGFARLLLGSVSEQLAHHAECPLAIVRSPVPAHSDG